MSSYTIEHKNGRCTVNNNSQGAQILQLFGCFYKTIIPPAMHLVRYLPSHIKRAYGIIVEYSFLFLTVYGFCEV